jgi:site-specific recombinase XerD
MKNELQRFLCYLEVEKGFSPKTVEAYQLDLERGLFPFLSQRGKTNAIQVSRDDIRAYLEYLATVKGNSSAARARKLAAVKSFFNYMVEQESFPANPATAIKSPKVPQKQPEYLTDEESIRLLRTIVRVASPQVRERDMAMVTLFIHTGLRVSELTSLKVTGVDLDSRQIKITRKGDREQYLPLNTEAAKALAHYMANRPEGQNGRFFVSVNGSDLARTYIYAIVKRYIRLAGINKGKCGPHLLRHTFCTRLHQKGVSPFTIKELAGHKSMDTTMKYVKIENREQAKAIDRLEFGLSYPDMRTP